MIIPNVKDRKQRVATLIAFALIPLSGFATDIYIPSLPKMGAVMHVSGIQIELTLTFFLISYGLSQLFIGSILDSFGRYRLSLVALMIFTMASLVIARTQNINLIYLMRVIHGITVAVIIVGKRAYFVDVYYGDRLKHILSLFTIIWSTGPIIAPFIGGYLQSKFGWQSNFYFLASFAAVFTLLEFIFGGETIKNFTKFNLRNIILIYKNMITTFSFTLGLILLGLSFSMVMVCNMTTPFIIEHHLNLSPVTAGYCALFLGLAWMSGGFIAKAAINRPFYKKLINNVGIQLMLITLMIGSLSLIANIYTLLGFAFAIHVTAGFTYTTYFTYSMGKFPQNAGIAGGLTGGIMYIIVSFLSYYIVSIIPAKDEKNLSYSYLILVLLSALIIGCIYLINSKKAGKINRFLTVTL